MGFYSRYYWSEEGEKSSRWLKDEVAEVSFRAGSDSDGERRGDSTATATVTEKTRCSEAVSTARYHTILEGEMSPTARRGVAWPKSWSI